MPTTNYLPRELVAARVDEKSFQATDSEWYRWSKFADARKIIMPKVGDTVIAELDKAGFVRGLAIVPSGPAPASATRQPAPPLAPATLQALAATRKPDPPDDEPDWLRGSNAPAEPPSFAGVHIEQNLRETVITRLACIKAAAEACAGLPVEDIIAAASAFESWCVR
jgi:hypothetical protein